MNILEGDIQMEKRLFEKHICRCGKTMKYDGIEASVVSDENEEHKILSDLDVYICKCGYKIWIHTTENIQILK